MIDAPLVDAFGQGLNVDEADDVETKQSKFLSKLQVVLAQHYHDHHHTNRAIVLIEPIIGADGVWTDLPSCCNINRQQKGMVCPFFSSVLCCKQYVSNS